MTRKRMLEEVIKSLLCKSVLTSVIGIWLFILLASLQLRQFRTFASTLFSIWPPYVCAYISSCQLQSVCSLKLSPNKIKQTARQIV